ncbi:MAG: hypothetical protein NXY57DRAFT_979864 [Lentinula lateritia]|uniref:Uncharacterized protein n=1 Tax=Lentinula lateritia TaxID=40482 RepID=A0ABQ8VT60_9AGAR|nr:MAG: hypothetical protein NXY57DRAFT_979864 [Lentinula lateritia]KAJ4499562.1 hypothetical protein C8R41DRAFT_893452 [Lentinula lateritia]
MEETMQVDDFGSTSAFVSQAPVQSADSGNIPTPLITREIQVKVHIRRPERDSWVYMGRGLVSQEVIGHSSRVVVRAMSTNKLLTQFGEGTDLQAEKRGNFVVVGCVEDSGVVSWSLNALNNSETLRLLASIELACYKCKNALTDPRKAGRDRKKTERIIKDDRRRRHRRRKDQEALIDAFAKSNISNEATEMSTDGVPAPS